MRILFLCHRIPYPPDKGEKTRAFHQLRALAGRHEVDLFTLVDDPADLVHREALAAYCSTLTVARILPKLARARSLPRLLTRSPLSLSYFYSSVLQQKIREAVARRRYDRVFVYCSAMAQYIEPRRLARRGGNTEGRQLTDVPVILDIVDVDSNKWSQYAHATWFPFSTVFRKEARDLRAYERRICEEASCVLVSTDREAQLARQIAPTARVHVVPIGVDTSFFTPTRAAHVDEPPMVVFTGDMGYFPNREGAIFFARDVLPRIHREFPGVRFAIVGRRPDRRVEQLRLLPHVEVTGSVPDVRPWLAQASVAVVPLKIAAGIQTKILEAMASGLPVVATPRAIQGLTHSVAEIIDAADTPQEFAEKILRLLRHPNGAARRGAEGRRRVSIEYSWTSALHKLLQLVEEPAGIPDGVLVTDTEKRSPVPALSS